ncbi:MAG: hypothetical protein E4H09_00115 [Spirochaetales bacterium]|nr:MAG: hypothetical protein E4H09_00115 [Spirochaetales bacterium]
MRQTLKSFHIIFVALLFMVIVLPVPGETLGPPRPETFPLLHFSTATGSVRTHELRISTDGGRSWGVPSGLPVRVLPANTAGTPLPVTAVAVHGSTPADLQGPLVLAAIGSRLFASTDEGSSWTEVDLADVTNPSSYITAVAIDPQDRGHWVIGTSYDGIYRSTDAGASWRDLTAGRGVTPLRLGAGFYEEVEGIRFTNGGTIVLTLGFGAGFVAVDPQSAVGVRLGPAIDGPTSYRRLATTVPSGETLAPGATVSIRTGELLPVSLQDATPERSAATTDRLARAADHTGIYISAPNASTENLDRYFRYVVGKGFSSVVVDLKDDLGRVTYASDLVLPNAVGAVEPWIDLPDLVERAHHYGIYVIGRIVVFKDPRLYAYDGNRYAIWDRRRDHPWGVFRTYTNEETGERRTVQVEHWVDPYSPEVWDYNISIAREVVTLGVDEIQFDYIRFPSDGNTEDVVTRYEVPGADRVQALEGFLSSARDALDVPIGIDVFGFNGWSSMNYLGQDITRLARYVDVISPMFYPSHFALPFLPQFSYLGRARVIYDLGTRRNQALAGPDTLIRPYIQAFLIGPELQFSEPTYREYLQLQVQGSRQAGSSGFTLWNASGRYYMLP